ESPVPSITRTLVNTTTGASARINCWRSALGACATETMTIPTSNRKAVAIFMDSPSASILLFCCRIFLPGTIILWDVQLLQLMPGGQRLFPCCVLFGRQKIGEEINVPARWLRYLGKAAFNLIQLYVLFYQIFIGDLYSFVELLFTPTVETISSSRFSFQVWGNLQCFADNKIFCLFVAGIADNRKFEIEPFVDVADSRF